MEAEDLPLGILVRLQIGIEQNLEQKLQTKVRVNYGAKKGSIEIAYFGEDELDRIYELLLGK